MGERGGELAHELPAQTIIWLPVQTAVTSSAAGLPVAIHAAAGAAGVTVAIRDVPSRAAGARCNQG